MELFVGWCLRLYSCCALICQNPRLDSSYLKRKRRFPVCPTGGNGSCRPRASVLLLRLCLLRANSCVRSRAHSQQRCSCCLYDEPGAPSAALSAAVTRVPPALRTRKRSKSLPRQPARARPEAPPTTREAPPRQAARAQSRGLGNAARAVRERVRA